MQMHLALPSLSSPRLGPAVTDFAANRRRSKQIESNFEFPAVTCLDPSQDPDKMPSGNDAATVHQNRHMQRLWSGISVARILNIMLFAMLLCSVPRKNILPNIFSSRSRAAESRVLAMSPTMSRVFADV